VPSIVAGDSRSSSHLPSLSVIHRICRNIAAAAAAAPRFPFFSSGSSLWRETDPKYAAVAVREDRGTSHAGRNGGWRVPAWHMTIFSFLTMYS
jgi:hypothetical protein